MTWKDWVRKGNQDGNVDNNQNEQEKPKDYWVQKIDRERKGGQDGNAENDQNEQEKGRSLPEEQKEKEKEQERGRDR